MRLSAYPKKPALLPPCAALLLAAAFPAMAQGIGADEARPPKRLPPELKVPARSEPWPIRMMIRPLDRGMFIRLPVMDTDPNRGATYGIMPIWVFLGEADSRIRHIHAPSLTYNEIFRWTSTYRYYFYPSRQAGYFAQASLSGDTNRTLAGEMEDLDFAGKDIALSGKSGYTVNGSKRFFGIGPDARKSDETNYTRKTLGYFARMGLPIFRSSGLKFNLAHELSRTWIDRGAVGTLPDIRSRFARQAPADGHWNSEFQLFLDYDTRDSAVTTTRGSYVKFLMADSEKAFGSDSAFQRYEIDARHFYKRSTESRFAAAGRLRYEQVVGEAPFFLLPQLGGKKTHRAYGEGRFIDKGMAVATLEERITAYKTRVAGVVTELEVAPFAGLGAVFSRPDRLARRYLRPVFGVAARAVTRPQVVGSIDVGVGDEGAAVFVDINYSY